MTWMGKFPAVALLVIAMLATTAGELQADWNLFVQLFEKSNLNKNNCCYGYTLVWEGGRLAPKGLENATVDADTTANRLDANVFFLHNSVLPERVRWGNNQVHPLVSAPAIDELARLLQFGQWPNPPQGTDAEKWHRYRDWLAQPGISKKLVSNQKDLNDRMAKLPGEYVQPMTVAQFNPWVKTNPNVHNIVLFINESDQLRVMDPNDSFHKARPAAFDNYLLTYQIQNQAGQLVPVWFNNVFFTREYIGRGDGRDGGPGRDRLLECEQPVLWEWDPDDDWLGNTEEIPFHPNVLSRPGPNVRPGPALRSGSVTFTLRAVDGASLGVVVGNIADGDSDAAKTEKIRQAVLAIDPDETEWRAIRWYEGYGDAWFVTFLHSECDAWVPVPAVLNYTDVTSSAVDLLVYTEFPYQKLITFDYGIAGGPAEWSNAAGIHVDWISASTLYSSDATAQEITDALFWELKEELGGSLTWLSSTSFRYRDWTQSDEARFGFDAGDKAFWTAGAALEVRLYDPPEP